MSPQRFSQSFSDQEVNVLAAMLEAAQTGEFKNPEPTEVFQHTSQKVLRLAKKAKGK